MIQKKEFIGIFIVPLVLCISCLYSRTAAPSIARNAGIKIYSGRASVKIYSQVNENLYLGSIFDNQIKDEKPYDSPAVKERTITRNEIKLMAAGDEYTFSILPTEVVTLHITSLDGNDVELVIYQYGKENKYTVKGTNRLGSSLAFQNR
ncbi:MAG: hypothetical protein LBD20_02745 [Spirochaetaceae bacterium]|jgi:hypothetical protein|nr:hypothetical protein [Spirochaetaceae bacterium]